MVEFTKLKAVIKREYIERVRTRWFLISTFLGPILMVALFTIPALLTARNMQRAQVTDFRILDATGTDLGRRVSVTLRDRALNAPERKALGDKAPPLVETQLVALKQADLAAAESTATADVMKGTTRGYLVIDSVTMTASRARYAGKNASSLGETQQIENALRSALLVQRLEAAGVNASRADSLSRVRAEMSSERIDSAGRGGSGLASAIFGFAIAFLLYMMIILYGQNILRSVLEEKTSRVAEVVISSVSPETLLAGKVIGAGAVGLTQQLVWMAFAGGISLYGFGVASAVGGIQMPHVSALQLVTLVLYFLLGYTFYAALFAAVGAMCSDQGDAQQAAQPVMMLLVFSIILVQPIMTQPAGTMATVMSILPFSAPIIMPLVMSGTQVPAWQLALSLGSLAASCVVAIWVSARIYRVGLLMTGKRPSMRELVRWVKYA